MLVVQPDGCGDAHDYGEFYDSISTSGDCRVRFKATNFGGRCIFHCHVLGHEDKGAMAWADVKETAGGSTMPTIPATPAQDSTTCWFDNGGSVTTPTSTTTTSTTAGACAGDRESCVVPGDCCSGDCGRNKKCNGDGIRHLLRRRGDGDGTDY